MWVNSGGTFCPHGQLLVKPGEQPHELDNERRIRKALREALRKDKR